MEPICISESTYEFIREHLDDDIRDCALAIGKRKDVDSAMALDQILGHQIASRKFPTLARTEGILYPPHINLEQSSSEQTALFKQEILRGRTDGRSFADLTAGYGIDFMHMSRLFETSGYVERNPYLARLAEHNFPLLGLGSAEIFCMDCKEFLSSPGRHCSCMFIDPARRDARGGKVVAIEDCEPDITKMDGILRERTSMLLVKLSPMLDIQLALRSLKDTCDVYAVSVDNECKELLFLLDYTRHHEEPMIHAVSIRKDRTDMLSFCQSEERNAETKFSASVGKYLYEPNASCMKTGAFRIICSRFHLGKLNPSTHLYTSDDYVADFPGRIFSVEKVTSFGKRDIQEATRNISRANITLRNFPSTEKEVRQRLRILDGGDCYIFATTLLDSSKALIITRKA